MFNQNRLAGGLGYQLIKNAQAELVYLCQVSSHGSVDPVSDQPVVERSNGFWLNLVPNPYFTRLVK